MNDRFGRGLFMSTAIVAMVAATPAMAQTRSFNVPAQSAETGISAFGRQAEIQIVAARKFTKGKKTNAVRGSMTVDAALRQLLEGTGLTFRSTGAQTYMVVQGGNVQGGASDAAEKAEVSGTVTDAATGRRLIGALVRLAPSGQTAVTDEQGQYRIVGVPAGGVSVTVNFLGMTAQQQEVRVEGDHSIDVDFAMGTGQDIVVYGTRSARALALNRERTAENSQTVLSSDLLGNFGGTTISDALRRAPGIAFVQNPETGEGSNIIVRGMAPDYNQVKLNGTDLPNGDGVGRSADLGNILASSVSSITISKTLLPSQDSAGTGGLVEIETKSPLDRPRRFAQLGMEGFKNGKGFGDGFLASGTVSSRFGAGDSFGISASVQYRKENISNSNFFVSGLIFGPWLPLLPNGQPATLADIDPRSSFPFGTDTTEVYTGSSNVQSSNNRVKTLTATISTEWQVSDSTNLKVDYVRSTRDAANSTVGISLSQLLGYALRPVPGLNGEQRFAVTDQDGAIYSSTTLDYSRSKATTDSFSFRGNSQVGRLKLDFRAGFASGRTNNPFNYSAQIFTPSVATDAVNLLPETFRPDLGLNLAFAPGAEQKFPVPRLTEAGVQALFGSGSGFFYQASGLDDNSGQSRAIDASISGRYEFSSDILKYIEFGASYKRTRFTNFTSTGSEYYGADADPFPAPETLGIEYGRVPFSRAVGGSFPIPIPTHASVRGFFKNIDGYVDGGQLQYFPPIPIALDGENFTREAELAGWMQSQVLIGKLEIVGGARFSQVQVTAAFPNSTSIFNELGQLDLPYLNSSKVIVKADASQTTFLPRVVFNWRPNDKFVLRAGYFVSVARPAVIQMNSTRDITLDLRRRYGPGLNQPLLSIRQGNEDLKPAKTDNFDLSAEYYFSDAGVIKFAAFYKSIANLLELNSIQLETAGATDLPDDPRFSTPNLYLQLTQPFNNPDRGKLWGFETTVERQLTFLPGWLSGLGLYANYTYTGSRKTEHAIWSKPIYDAGGQRVGVENIEYEFKRPLAEQPKHSATIGITYNKYGFDGSIYYTVQSRRPTRFVVPTYTYGRNTFAEGTSSLDARLEYRFNLGVEARLFVEGRNLLKGPYDASVETLIGGNGSPYITTNASYLGGRSLRGGISVDF